jgi:geranylgeranyl pyrophosphate synthase
MLNTLKRVVQGEIKQLRPNHRMDEASCIEVAREKTGSLMSVVCRLPALWFQADEVSAEALTRFGEHFGVAFQIVDDLLDLTGEDLTLGKGTMSDIRNGKRTLPLVYLMDFVGTDAFDSRFLRLVAAEQPQETDLAWLSELVKESGCAERTLETASRYAERAEECLVGFAECSAKTDLLDLLGFVINRCF